MLELRPYQRDAVDAVYRHLKEKTNNPCVVIPTAGGKSICIAQVAKDAVTQWGGRVLILAHVKELVDQNAKELCGICPELDVGVYSAGLNRRDTENPVVVAGIQSIYNKVDLFKPFDLIMVDEVHMVPPDGEGRYQTFLQAAKALNPNVRLVGWTATPFRTQGGLICKPENLFNEICYEATVRDLIDAGYICKLTTKAGSAHADLDHLHIRAGEFVPEDVEKAMGEESVIRNACHEIVEKTCDRKACLIFCTSVAHCKKVAKLIEAFSHEECPIVTGDTPAEERDRIIERLKGNPVTVDLFGTQLPPLKFCCNVGVLTTGTNIRRLDAIAILRPTASAGLLIQMVGRGFRLSPETGKEDCLILDYGKNIERFGPIDNISIHEPKRAGQGEALAKVCPQCNSLLPLNVMLCKECGYQFPSAEKERRMHEERASNLGILSGEETLETYDVRDVGYCVWTKRNAPPTAPRTVRVTYRIDMMTSFSEWICPEHTGFARSKFEKWWRAHTEEGTPMPSTADEVCEHAWNGLIRPAVRITVRRVSGNTYPEVSGWELGESPLQERLAATEQEPDWDDDLPF